MRSAESVAAEVKRHTSVASRVHRRLRQSHPRGVRSSEKSVMRDAFWETEARCLCSSAAVRSVCRTLFEVEPESSGKSVRENGWTWIHPRQRGLQRVHRNGREAEGTWRPLIGTVRPNSPKTLDRARKTVISESRAISSASTTAFCCWTSTRFDSAIWEQERDVRQRMPDRHECDHPVARRQRIHRRNQLLD